MSENKIQYLARSTVRLKKFADGADPDKDVPDEVLERQVELTQQEASDVATGRAYLEFQADAGRAFLRSHTDGRVLAERPLAKKTITKKEIDSHVFE